MTQVLEVDLTDPALYAGSTLRDVFTELRAAGGVHRNPSVDIGLGREAPPFWSVVRHAEIQQANRDFGSLSSADGVALPKHTAGIVDEPFPNYRMPAGLIVSPRPQRIPAECAARLAADGTPRC